jgi:hypothetical protein
MKMRTMSGLILVALAMGCGPRLKHAEAPDAATMAADAPVAKISVKYDDSKLGADRKYTEDGQFTVSGLFYKDGQPTDTTVKVALQKSDAAVTRSYSIDLAELAGASTKVEMWDDGFLTVVIPAGASPKPGFATSNQNIKAVSLEAPGQAPSTCYFGKEVLDGQIRFALCELQTDSPRVTFVDAVPDPATAAPAAAEPAAEAPAAEPAAAEPSAAAPKKPH